MEPVLSSPVTVVFGLRGMGVSPAGIQRVKTGHHHLLIDEQKLPSVNVPSEHSLQLILGDHLHILHNPVVVSDTINIIIK